jgi:hypothetical protein
MSAPATPTPPRPFLFAEAIGYPQSQARRSGFRSTARWREPTIPRRQAVLQHLSGLFPNVTVRTDVLSTDDYLAWLTQADLILLPTIPVIKRADRSLL